MKLINNDYSLNANNFCTSDGEVWRLIGTDGSSKLAKDAIDEWRSGDDYIKISRENLLKKQEQNKIFLK